MKKVFKVIVLVAAMAIASVSCVKEAEVALSQDIEIESGVAVAAPSFGVATKAVKAGWEDADQVLLFLNGDVADGHQMVLTYNEAHDAWTINVDKDVFMAMPSEGTFSAVHHSGEIAFSDNTFTNYAGGAVYVQKEGAYKVTRAGSHYYFSADVALAVYDNMYQLTVVNVADPTAVAECPEVTTEWTLAVVNGDGEPVSDQVIDLYVDETAAVANTTGIEAGGPAVANEENAVAFFPQILADADNGVYTFLLTDPDGKQYYRTFEKEVGTIAEGSAIKVNWPAGWAPVVEEIEAPELEVAEVDSTGRVYDIIALNEALAEFIAQYKEVVTVEGETSEHAVGEYTFTLTCADGYVFVNGDEENPTVKTYTWEIVEVVVPVETTGDWIYRPSGNNPAALFDGRHNVVLTGSNGKVLNFYAEMAAPETNAQIKARNTPEGLVLINRANNKAFTYVMTTSEYKGKIGLISVLAEAAEVTVKVTPTSGPAKEWKIPEPSAVGTQGSALKAFNTPANLNVEGTVTIQIRSKAPRPGANRQERIIIGGIRIMEYAM